MLSAPTAYAAPSAADPAQIIRELARPAPATIAFTEVRFSPLLKAPLIVSGELGYEGAAQLTRRVTQPYQETTHIRGDAVQMQREGQRTRTFSSARAPELRGLLESFSGLLSGDPARLASSFDMQAQHTANGWRLNLAPKNADRRQRVHAIVVTGQAREPRCVTMQSRDGGASFIVFGDTPEPLAQPSVTREALQQHCDVEPASPTT